MTTPREEASDVNQPDRPDDSAVIIEEACALIAGRTGSTIEDASRGLYADADAFGMPVVEVAEDIVNTARAQRRTQPSTLSELLATAKPRPHQAR